MERAITNYRVVEECEPGKLAAKVNENLAEGWQPLGPALPCTNQPECTAPIVYVQTLVKYGPLPA
ncbi:DUF1737 domain-containing protein [Zavarzinella formosa]|uniref:DUF1737 domain-containing protein n=1 Tax=Zavarzinella formosa TaxID=360055 RepID=UPI0002E6BF19|nr:DUF1737 domain-containing protein [Zavarzinella formosa]